MAKSIQKVPLPTFTSEPKTSQVSDQIYKMMADPMYSKADILNFIRQTCMQYPYLTDTFGVIDDDVIAEVERLNSQNTEDERATINRSSNLFDATDIVKMDKKQKQSVIEIPTREEARFLVDIYYQQQNKRIVAENQLRALKQNKDNNIESSDGTNNFQFLSWYVYNQQLMEQQIAAGLKVFADTNYLSRWAKEVKGIGPVIATCLVADLQIITDDTGATDMHAGNWWSFCGLNDNNRPWLGTKASTAIVNRIVEENNGIVDNDVVAAIAAETQWSIEHYERFALRNDGSWDKQKLISASSVIPYSKKMKVLMYKIGHSFVMQQNKKDSLYGRLLKQRKELEMVRNERGEYKDQAARILKEKNFGHDTKAYQAYSEGLLPAGHIAMRAQRYATKLFISHLFEAAYYNMYGHMTPKPYVLQFIDGHADYIPPEVPYDSIDRDAEYVKINPSQKIVYPKPTAE